MILGADKIIELVRRPAKDTLPLLENIDESQIEGIEGVSVDLRVDKVFVLLVTDEQMAVTSLMRDSRSTPEYDELSYVHQAKEIWQLDSACYYLVQTMETINTPDWLAPVCYPRTTLFRSGVKLHCAPVSPGYQGVLTFGLEVDPALDWFVLQRGARIAQVRFELIYGAAVAYDGQWQGGKLASQGESVHAFRAGKTN
jgi:deoxycytidine triphosphate deaminase